ncbi:exosome RNA helicase MTR4-like [Lingula anatina]|uniref:Exosome RNA helicase MTR4-like n=1 Tax=Lingula anatina TaxID=7574 RepID=A0A1S3H4Q8_LINAN|nr:exosome RNA helicase MTR4-like [Lingula anatina]|eukprot:XP_013380119.1 exosome RNA helicase MTR4-like [Lingula anatina]
MVHCVAIPHVQCRLLRKVMDFGDDLFSVFEESGRQSKASEDEKANPNNSGPKEADKDQKKKAQELLQKGKRTLERLEIETENPDGVKKSKTDLLADINQSETMAARIQIHKVDTVEACLHEG